MTDDDSKGGFFTDEEKACPECGLITEEGSPFDCFDDEEQLMILRHLARALDLGWLVYPPKDLKGGVNTATRILLVRMLARMAAYDG